MSEENDWVDGALDKNLFKMTTAKVKKHMCIMLPVMGGGGKFTFSSVQKKYNKNKLKKMDTFGKWMGTGWKEGVMGRGTQG